MIVSETCEVALSGLAAARVAAYDPAPGRLRKVVVLGRTLGQMGTPRPDALEEIESALYADGLLPADTPSQQRAWRHALDAASDAFDNGTNEALPTIAADAVAQADDGAEALRLVLDRCATFANDGEMVDAVRDALSAVGRADEMLAAPFGYLRAERAWFGRGEERAAAEAKERAEMAEWRAERDADSVFAALPPDADFASALRDAHSLLTEESADMIAGQTIARLARPPVRQYVPATGTDPFAGGWQEADDTAIALHEKAKSTLEAREAGFDPAAAILALELRAQTAGTPEALALATALKRERLGMNAPVEVDEPEPEPLSVENSLADLCSPPGLVGEIVDWMEASSDRPNRALMLGAALTFVATLAGRKFATPSNLRSNNYVVTLAPSGHGKDHAIGRIKTLSAAAGLDRYVGPARIMSASALRKLVAREPAVACFMDEFGGFIGQIHDRRAGLHNAMIRYDMLEMFSAAGTFFAGAEYAGEAATKVFAPNFSISGTSTPESFWSSLSSLSASDGLLARLILLDVTGPKPARVKPRLSPNDVPAALVDAVRALAERGGNLAATLSDRAPKAITVPLDAEAEEIDADNIAGLDAAESSASPEAMPFLNRVREHALKLALVVAVGCNPSAPVITGPVMEWAYRLARLSTATLIRESADRIADNDRSAAYGKILRVIKGASAAGIQPSRIGDRLKGIDKRMREELLADMTAAGRVRLVKTAPAGGRGGRVSERYFAS
ncbi:hypothetical protein DLM45_13265 [Hyphomicrobium methylovorum]|uniref:hypothetical protein n=1 Tax=Hyphomicrobium methylovorum TaxID=84 RepID=UPI0015E74382|nr:hypothetical protein [Hyphomicrobium methylovorum]MBA2127183.1 hypothetical protein [Hyphomicrobium methylovorum]